MADTFQGYEIGENDSGEWVFLDTGELVGRAYRRRPCGHCGTRPTADGHDGCLGTLPDVMNACCGHGNAPEAYVQFFDGRERLAGADALDFFKAHGKGPPE